MSDNGTLFSIQSVPVSSEINQRSDRCTYAEDRLRANQLDKLVLDTALDISLTISLEIAQVSDMAFLIRRGSVVLAVRIDWYT